MNTSAILLLALLAGTPLLLAVLGELVVELSGLINIGLEGVLLFAAMCGVAAAKLSGSVAIGFAAAIAGAAIATALFGWLTIVLRSDQIIAGAGLNFLAGGLTSVIYSTSTDTFTGAIPRLAPLNVGGVSLGDPIALLSWTLIPFAVFFLLRRTRFGLRLRATGEDPAAVRLHGYSTTRYKWAALWIEALLCGIAGA